MGEPTGPVLGIPPKDLPAFAAGAEPYTLGPDSLPQRGLPSGEVIQQRWVINPIYQTKMAVSRTARQFTRSFA